jgi:ABC-type Fe3+-hydroxamate transport system substrate-binding protein
MSGQAQNWTFRVHLVGGLANGRAVDVPELVPKIVVYLDDNCATVAGLEALPDVPAHGGGTTYRLVEPLGPEVPSYVAGGWD